MDRRPNKFFSRLAAAAAVCCLTACFPAHEPALVSNFQLAPAFTAVADFYVYELAWAQFDAYTAYTETRIVEIETYEREPYAFGPWQAELQPELTDAPADGGVAEWREGYFITHEWSGAGRDWLSAQPGDTLEVNGRIYTVERIFEYPKDSYYEEVIWITGSDGAVFQTCVPFKDYNRIIVTS